MDKLIEMEEVTIGGQVLQLRHEAIPIDDLELDPNNPRIRYRLAHTSGKNAEQELLGWRDVIMLRKDIEKTGGLRERIIVQRDPKTGKYKVVEGNCRTVCYRSLHEKNPKDARWQNVPAKVLPPDVDRRAVAILLMDFDVIGKLEWRAHEKAAQVHLMHATLKMPLDEIALYMHGSKTTVQRLLDAHKAMTEKFLAIDDGAYEKKGEGAWSFFEELYKSKDLREHIKSDPEFVDDFSRWVGDDRLPHGADVRVLPKVLSNPQAAKKFKEGPAKTAFAEAMKVIAQEDPSIDSDFFKLLGKMRDALTSAAQVKEILKIRTDKAARRKLLDTYEAMLDFMNLADVDPAEINAKPVNVPKSA